MISDAASASLFILSSMVANAFVRSINRPRRGKFLANVEES
jgi:hypothetical protein